MLDAGGDDGLCPRVSELSAKLEQDRMLTQRSLQKLEKMKEMEKQNRKIDPLFREKLINVQEDGDMPKINFKVKDGYRVEKGYKFVNIERLESLDNANNPPSEIVRSNAIGPPGTAPQALESRTNSLVLHGDPSWSKVLQDYSEHEDNFEKVKASPQ